MTPRRLRSNLRLLTQPWIGPILALITVICGGALGYRITEGWDWGDCFWMVLITISTIGYGEVNRFHRWTAGLCCLAAVWWWCS